MLYTHLIGCYIHARTQHECMYPYHTNTHTHTHTHAHPYHSSSTRELAERWSLSAGSGGWIFNVITTRSPVFVCMRVFIECLYVCVYFHQHSHTPVCLRRRNLQRYHYPLSWETQWNRTRRKAWTWPVSRDLYHVTCITGPVSHMSLHMDAISRYLI